MKYLPSLRHFTINNVKDLQLNERSLNWCGAKECIPEYSGYYVEHPSLDVDINNTTISEIQAHVFSERLRDIRLNKVTVNRLKSYSFTNLKSAKKLEVIDSVINGIEAQAFKKFSIDHLLISNTKMGFLPSRTFSEIEVYEDFRILNSNFDTIKPLGFIIRNPKTVEIINSEFKEVESESFSISSKGKVTLKNNYFKKLHPSAFIGFSATKEPRLALPELLFSNNSLNEIKRDVLNFNRTSFAPKIGAIILNQTCTCADIHIWQSDTGYIEEIHCLVKSGRAMIQTNAKAFKTSNCDPVSNTWVITVTVIVSLLVLVVAVSILLFFVYKKYRRNKEKEYLNRGRNKNGSLGLIVPDGRTYRETELHVIVEKAELLTTEL